MSNKKPYSIDSVPIFISLSSSANKSLAGVIEKLTALTKKHEVDKFVSVEAQEFNNANLSLVDTTLRINVQVNDTEAQRRLAAFIEELFATLTTEYVSFTEPSEIQDDNLESNDERN